MIARRFFGFPVAVSFDRSNVYANYADITINFPEGYSPDGCQLCRIEDIVKKIFKAEDVEVLSSNGINSILKFKYRCSMYCYKMTPERLTAYNAGAAGIILDLIIAANL